VKNAVVFPQPLWSAAQYNPPPLAEYCGNPLIEALPPINAPEDVASVLHVRPIFQAKELELPAHIRTHCVKRLKDWVEPRPIFIEVEQILAVLIRQGYLARNPLQPTTMRMLYALGRRDPKELSSRIRQSNVAGAVLFEGLSGVGKSTLLETLLALYPQVIEHERYQGAPFFQKQLSYLIVPCPSNASPRALCLEFFKAVDDKLGTKYYKDYVNTRQGSDVLLIEMALVAATFHIGVLIIDEVQNLRAARSAQRSLKKAGRQSPILGLQSQELMNFFVKLINWVGIPTIFVGTGDVMPLFDETFQYVRRATADGHVTVNPIPPGTAEWHTLLAKLWRYQWLKSPLPFDVKSCSIPSSWEAQLSARCHYLSCGIPDVLVKLFMQAQWLALRSRRETLDMGLLEEAYDTQLTALQPSLEALRAGGADAADEYEYHYPNPDAGETLESPPLPGAHDYQVPPSSESPATSAAPKRGPKKAARDRVPDIHRNAPVVDLSPQFKVAAPVSEDPDLTAFDLRATFELPGAIQKIRDTGIVFNLRKLA
jgi:hypothetical protein